MILFNFKYMYILIMYVQWMLEMYKFFSLKISCYVLFTVYFKK